MAIEFDVTGIKLLFVAEHRHQACCPALVKASFDGAKIAFKIRIAVHHEEGRTKRWQGSLQGTAGSQQSGSVVHELKAHRPAAAVAQCGFDLFAQVANQPYNPFNSLVGKKVGLMFGKWPAVELD